jgi:putative membrane protein
MIAKHSTCLAGVALVAFALALAATPQNTADQKMDSGSSRMMKSSDLKFAQMAAQGGMAEVELGQMAAQKGTNADVKAFGQQMADDHTKANDDLKSVAAKQGVTLPSGLSAKDQALKSKLQNLSGEEFDRAYMKAMVKDHEEDVKEFQKEANNGKNPQIKDFASRTLPVLQGHLDKAKSVDSSVAK